MRKMTQHVLGAAGLALIVTTSVVWAQEALECALDSGQFQAAVLTGYWAWRSSYCAGLR